MNDFNSNVHPSEESSSPDSDLQVNNPIIRKEIPDEEKFRVIHVVAYIMAAVIGREYSGWNSTLTSGFGLFGVAQLTTAAACIGYYLCMSEIWSAIPFSGGSYGLSRASLGFYVGFLDGCCEALVYVAHSAISAMGLGLNLVALFELEPHYQLVFCVIFYAISVWLTAQKSLVLLRRTYMALAVVSFIILFMYLFGMLKYVDFMKNAPLNNSPNVGAFDNWFVGGMKQYMFIMSNALTPYVGVKSFALLTIVTKDPKNALPKGVVIGFCVIFAMNMFTIFVMVSQPGGILYTATLAQPMIVGNQLMFNLDPLETFRLTMWLSLPAAFAKLLTYILPGGNLFHCLGNSYYLPPGLFLNKTQDRTNGCIVTAVLGMGLCVATYYQPTINLYNVCVMATMITDLTFIYSYIQLRTTYSTVERSFVSPWGITGAIYTFVFFSLVGISAAFFQGTWFNVKFAAAFFVILTVYYYLVARKGDMLCEEEDKIFLQLHVRNYNRSKKTKMKRANRPNKSGSWFGSSSILPDSQSSDRSSTSTSLSKTIGGSNEKSTPKNQRSSGRYVAAAGDSFDEKEEMMQLSKESPSQADLLQSRKYLGGEGGLAEEVIEKKSDENDGQELERVLFRAEECGVAQATCVEPTSAVTVEEETVAVVGSLVRAKSVTATDLAVEEQSEKHHAKVEESVVGGEEAKS